MTPFNVSSTLNKKRPDERNPRGRTRTPPKHQKRLLLHNRRFRRKKRGKNEGVMGPGSLKSTRENEDKKGGYPMGCTLKKITSKATKMTQNERFYSVDILKGGQKKKGKEHQMGNKQRGNREKWKSTP